MPKLLRLFNLKGAIVTLDAMGAQRKIAIEIIHQGADYLLALKGNQGTLYGEVKDFFEDPESLKYAEEKGAVVQTVEDHDKGHGRIEKRTCTVTDYLDWLPAKVRRDWLGLCSLVRVETETLLSNGSERRETRYYLSSMAVDASLLGIVTALAQGKVAREILDELAAPLGMKGEVIADQVEGW